MRHAAIVLSCLVLSAGTVLTQSASAQSVLDPPGFTKTVNLSGPRFGLTALSTGVVDELQKRSIGLGPNITPAGVALAIAGGVTFRAGSMNVPMNVPSCRRGWARGSAC